jgi:hypothetical protein
MGLNPKRIYISRNRDTSEQYNEIVIAPSQVRGIITPTDDDMRRINELAATGLKPEDVYVFKCVVSTNALDSYFTRMTQQSLENYAADATAGNPLMTGHRWGTLPVGRSFSGRVEEIDGLLSVIVRDYMLRAYEIGDTNTDVIARGIQAGTIKSMSIGFGGSDCWYRCSICGRSIMDRECPHYPGLEYDGVRAFAWVENARMIEHSLVYANATPGCLVRKAKEAAERGELSGSELSILESNLRCRLLDTSKPAPGKREQNKEESMKARAFLDKLRSFFSLERFPLLNKALDALRSECAEDAGAETVIDRAGAMLREAITTATEFADAARAAGIETVEQLKSLTERAKAGDAYRAELIDQTIKEGIRSQGESFNEDLWKKILEEPGRSLDDIKGFRDQFASQAKDRFGSGSRQITPQEPDAKPRGAVSDFEKLSAEEQKREVDDFLQRTGGVPGAK